MRYRIVEYWDSKAAAWYYRVERNWVDVSSDKDWHILDVGYTSETAARYAVNKAKVNDLNRTKTKVVWSD